MPDPSAVAAHRQAIAVAGVAIVYSRRSGLAPNVVTVSASVNAVVRTMRPDSQGPAQDGLGASQPGAVNQDQRLVIVMAVDLTSQGIALPLRTGDKISVMSDDEAPIVLETLNVDRFDPYKRAFAGAIEIFASAPT